VEDVVEPAGRGQMSGHIRDEGERRRDRLQTRGGEAGDWSQRPSAWGSKRRKRRVVHLPDNMTDSPP
jgi:hypothetical protein